MRFHAAGLSDIGRKRRHNEDAFLIDDELGLFVVADGLGGHAAGEVASHEAVDAIHAWVSRERASLGVLAARPDDVDAQREARRTVERAIMAATYHVFGLAEHDAEKSGMGTTVSLLAIAGASAVTAQVGDSRIYRVRDGRALQMTDDHTLVAMHIRQGLITAAQAPNVPYKNMITRAVGSHEYVEVDTAAFPVARGDTYLICSDGLHGYLDPAELPPLLEGDPEDAAERLIALANDRGGKDNITAVVVKLLA